MFKLNFHPVGKQTLYQEITATAQYLKQLDLNTATITRCLCVEFKTVTALVHLTLTSSPITSLSFDVTHHAIDKFNEHRDVAEIVTVTHLSDEFPRVTLLPKYDILIEILEELSET